MHESRWFWYTSTDVLVNKVNYLAIIRCTGRYKLAQSTKQVKCAVIKPIYIMHMTHKAKIVHFNVIASFAVLS